MRHTSKPYEHELGTLRDKLLTMGSLAEEIVGKGLQALATRDAVLATQSIAIDARIDALECEVDELCMRILAMRQPVASDLRFVTTALKTVTDLERIGDLGVNLCERVAELAAEPPLEGSFDLDGLASAAMGVLRDALDAFVARDVASATELIRRDAAIDARYSAIYEEVLKAIARDPAVVYRATRIQSIAKYLERIADHAINMAEAVVFLVKGKDIRHRHYDG